MPVFQFGSFESVTHLVFRKEEREKLCKEKRSRLYLQLIRLFTREYENLIWVWNLEEENFRDAIARRRIEMLDEAINRINQNPTPILQSLNYIEYYENSKKYFKERIRQNEKLFDQYQHENRRRAITSILIDSYAHNISAHSLTTLKWWFQQRIIEDKAGALADPLAKNNSIKEYVDGIGSFLQSQFTKVAQRADLKKGAQDILTRWYRYLEHQESKAPSLSPVITQLLPVAPQLAPLFRFLMEKGAFWSGIIRDHQFGGEIKTLYDVIWEDLIKNPLYVGTIAHSEQVRKVHFRIVIYGYQPFGPNKRFKKEPLRRTYTIKQNSRGELIDGILATVDVSGRDDSPVIRQHQFYQNGKQHDILKAELKQCEVFFPGGVVGKHAFLTLIENEIRNVKHFGKAARREMAEKGLTLAIGIRPAALSRRVRQSSEPLLYKVGVWLDHKTSLVQNGQNLVLQRIEQLKEDVITKNNRAKLGGNFQDKICAAMLFNNYFSSVQPEGWQEWESWKSEKEITRSQAYYPWIRSAYSEGPSEDGKKEDNFEVQPHQCTDGALNT